MLQQEDSLGLAHSAGVNLAGKIGGRALHFLSEVLLARTLGAAGFGLFSIAWNMLRIGGLIVPLGLDTGLLDAGGREAARGGERLPFYLRMAVWLALLSGLGAAILMAAASGWLAGLFRKPEVAPLLVGIALGLPFASVVKVLAAGLRAGGRAGAGILVEEVWPPLAMTVFVLGFLLRGGGVSQAVTAAWLSFFLSAGGAVFLARRTLAARFLALDWARAGAEIRALLRFSLPTALAGAFATLILLVDRLLVGIFLPAVEVGIYQAIALIALVFTTILSAFKLSVSPRVPELFHRRDMEGLRRLAAWSTRWGLYASMPFFLFILLVPASILHLLFGPEYPVGAVALALMAAAQMANVASGPIEFFLIFTGRRGDWLALSAGAFALTVALHLWLIPRMGLEGAALAVLLTFSALSLAAVIRVRRHLGFWIHTPALWKGLAAAVLSVALVWKLALLAVAPFLPLLAALGLAIAVLFFAILLMLGLESDDQQRLAGLWARLRGRT